MLPRWERRRQKTSGNRAKKMKSDPRAKLHDPNWVQPTPVQTSTDDTPAAQSPQPKPESSIMA